ncbi:MAG: Unknown protein [uncultured Sulfurovum sp.]|uniref:Uncharacterized protein n=1 Tax=uncultured Sulfurovum sp. TaxID=269237 RepID=A0A6S6S4W8_9BACT|nr:MAG: Unknown protein [uncultured Sulfurovum sp.]
MNIIKTVSIALALMTSTAFADFTIKDLFISGGTDKPVKSKDAATGHDCQ